MLNKPIYIKEISNFFFLRAKSALASHFHMIILRVILYGLTQHWKICLVHTDSQEIWPCTRRQNIWVTFSTLALFTEWPWVCWFSSRLIFPRFKKNRFSNSQWKPSYYYKAHLVPNPNSINYLFLLLCCVLTHLCATLYCYVYFIGIHLYSQVRSWIKIRIFLRKKIFPLMVNTEPWI